MGRLRIAVLAALVLAFLPSPAGALTLFGQATSERTGIVSFVTLGNETTPLQERTEILRRLVFMTDAEMAELNDLRQQIRESRDRLVAAGAEDRVPGNVDGVLLSIEPSELQDLLDSMLRLEGTVAQEKERARLTEQGQRIADAASSVPSPGNGWCAMWVSMVYQRAGFGYPGGDANDMYWRYCTEDNLDNLLPGMILAVPSHTNSRLGVQFGHVAVYVGDGKVMDNVGYVRTSDLEWWISYYSTTYPVKWGYAATF